MGRPADLPAGDLSQARGLVPLLAAVFVALAVVTDSDLWWRMVLVPAPVVAFTAWSARDWYRRGWSMAVLAPVVIGSTIAVVWGGRLETSLFLVALLALAAAAWERRPVVAVTVVVACLAMPGFVAAIRPDSDLAWTTWTGGVVFPAVLGWSVRRQERLTVELARARSELAEQAVLEERRRIARDVHDLVGHGLSAVMLQVTSARHVLWRSPASADEALASAEEVGRRSLRDLRRTVGLLRDSHDSPRGPALPSAAQVAELAATYRDAGLDVEYQSVGDLASVDPTVGLTVYRVAQEALANAAKHMSRGRTRVRLRLTAQALTLEVTSHSPTGSGPVTERPLEGHYGLPGMRERAEVVGASLFAGPCPEGWRVRLSVLQPARPSMPRPTTTRTTATRATTEGSAEVDR